MTYISWAALFEGATDEAYFQLLVPRLMEDIVLKRGTRTVTIPPDPAVRFYHRSPDAFAREACEAKDAFHLVFIHSDTGGRALEASLDFRSKRYCEEMNTLCAWPPVRCVAVSPRHEMEAWVISDPGAVTGALGYRGSFRSVGLPESAREAEKIIDPKATLTAAVKQIRGGRRSVDVRQIFPAIAQRQSLDQLRQADSFMAFENSLVDALADLGCVAKRQSYR